MTLNARLLRGFGLFAPGRTWARNPVFLSPHQTNCVILGTNVLAHAYPDAAVVANLKYFMLNAGTGPFENIEAAVDLGIAETTTMASDWMPGEAYVVQKWTGLTPLESGHFIIVLVARDGTMWIMESTPVRPPSQWLRQVPYQHPHDYFNVPEANVRVARLL